MVFDSLFRKNQPKEAQKKAPVGGPEKRAENIPPALQGMDAPFEKELESPEKLMAEEILKTARPAPSAQKLPQKTQAVQKIPAFVSLDKYKEIRLALRDMKTASSEMRRTLEGLRQNRDAGTNLLNVTISGLERIEGNIDKIRGVLRT